MDNIFHPGTFLIASFVCGILAIWLSTKTPTHHDHYARALHMQLMKVRDKVVSIGILLFLIAGIWQIVLVTTS